ncbi:MAG: iron-containing alcohol dehydrogenase [Coriobacteriales bacterium]|jgi:alcohol dehydrogenase class IV
MERPYKVRHATFVGIAAIAMSGIMLLLYIIPSSPGALVPQEWAMVLGWSVLGVVFFVASKLRYGEKFGTEVEVALDNELEARSEARAKLDHAFEVALGDVRGASVAATTGAATQAAGCEIGDFSYFLPVNVEFGWGKSAEAGAVAARLGHRVLLVTGGNSVRKLGTLDRVRDSLLKAGLECEVFGEVTPNPLTTTAQRGADLARERGCDVVVGLGGGSVMDCAKAIAFMARNDGDVNDYIFGRKSGDAALPLVLIPTTCGTGSEGNGFAVLTNPDTGDKKSLRTNAIVASASIVDPQLMSTLPKKQLASVGFDALCHCIEAYTARRAQPLTDALALYAIGLISDNLVKLYREDDGTPDAEQDRAAWESMAIAATIGGMVINTAGVTLAHGMEHPASGKRDIVHGQGLAAIEPVAVEASYRGDPVKFGVVSRLLGGYAAADCADCLRGLLRDIGLDVRLSELGVKEEDIPWMAENCFKVSAGNVENNPVVFDRAGVEDLYRKAM